MASTDQRRASRHIDTEKRMDDRPKQAQKRKNEQSDKSSTRNEPQLKKPRLERWSKQKDARAIATQTSSSAFKHGEVNIDKFVKSREYEISALERGLINSKKALARRAFQQVPKDLRRRTASHNVKRVPKRLQPRARREVSSCSWCSRMLVC